MCGLHSHGVDSVTVINLCDTQCQWAVIQCSNSCLMFNSALVSHNGINRITVLIIVPFFIRFRVIIIISLFVYSAIYLDYNPFRGTLGYIR